jgi:Putative Flp pilus-assembly TadE/G-like
MLEVKASNFRVSQSGATVVMFGVSVPILAMVVAVAVEYASLANRRATLQVAADSAALAAATELGLANTTDQRVEAVAKSVANVKLYENGVASANQAAITAQVIDERTAVRVTIAENVPSVMGRVMNLASTDLGAKAVARNAGRTRLCLLGLSTTSPNVVHLEKDARVTAQGCAIYSNSKSPKGLVGDQNASATASLICSAGGFSGKRAQFTPSPTTDCPVLADPLQSQAAPPVGACTSHNSDKVIKGGVVSLAPGTYCGLTITKGAQVTLQKDGIYVFNDGPLIVQQNSSLTGTNVAFYFTGDKAGLRFDTDSTISLTAPRNGPMAGILMFDDRNVGNPIVPPLGLNLAIPPLPLGVKLRQYRIISDDARMLLGTIYLPGGRLVIDSKKPVADRSAYTVIVANRVELYEGPNLYLNTDYAATDIPLPKGVGPQSGQVSLVQ